MKEGPDWRRSRPHLCPAAHRQFGLDRSRDGASATDKGGDLAPKGTILRRVLAGPKRIAIAARRSTLWVIAATNP
jgi:hypothetical protein